MSSMSSPDCQITAMYRHHKSSTSENVRWIKSDLDNLNIEELHEEMKDLDILVHNAASKLPGSTKEEKSYIRNVNVNASLSLFECAAKRGVKKVIFTSGLNILQKPLPQEITEASQTDPQTVYGGSKWETEESLKSCAEQYGFRYNVLRISSPVSFDLDLMPETIVKKWINMSRAGQKLEVYGKGSRTQDFVAVKDISSAFVACVQNLDIDGVFNIASGSELSMLRLAQIITEKFGNEYGFSGTDTQESDRWNISIERASRLLNYRPQYTAEAAIRKLLESV